MKIYIPEYIALEQRQIDKAQAWFDRRNERVAHSRTLTLLALAL